LGYRRVVLHCQAYIESNIVSTTENSTKDENEENRESECPKES
jgi:hypothetical protein